MVSFGFGLVVGRSAYWVWAGQFIWGVVKGGSIIGQIGLLAGGTGFIEPIPGKYSTAAAESPILGYVISPTIKLM